MHCSAAGVTDGVPSKFTWRSPNGTAFGDEASEEVVKVKGGHKDGALIPQDWCPGKK